MIFFHKAGKSFGKAVALQPTDLNIAANKTTVLIGLSGSGKSTVLRLISGLLEPTTGWIEIDGKKLARDSLREFRRRMGYVIQSGDLFPHLTARRNILLVACELRLGMDEMAGRVEELCALTRLPGVLLDRYPVELSGGEQRRVSLIRALMLKPDLLLLDEPMGALDPMVRAGLEQTKDYSSPTDWYFKQIGQASQFSGPETFPHRLVRWTVRQLVLVSLSLAVAIGIGVPLGTYASRGGLIGEFILALTGLIQTVPALALLALLVPIPFLGIPPVTAIVALFLYGLLPIVRNTATGLRDIPPQIRDVAEVLDLKPRTRLLKIFLPLASPAILAGIKTSAIINIGSATLAALIGAGGLGEPIISRLNLNDNTTILEGAVPAALLAIAAQGLFSIFDRIIIPQGLRLRPA